jgi:hypothetical protein
MQCNVEIYLTQNFSRMLYYQLEICYVFDIMFYQTHSAQSEYAKIVKLSLSQAVEANRAVRCEGSTLF